MTDRHEGEFDADPAALLDRLGVIEDQPLEQRAASFAALHDALQARLES